MFDISPCFGSFSVPMWSRCGRAPISSAPRDSQKRSEPRSSVVIALIAIALRQWQVILRVFDPRTGTWWPRANRLEFGIVVVVVVDLSERMS